MIRPLWIEINLKALRHNLAAIVKFVGRNVKIVATIKQSAYGHGLIPVARNLAANGVDFFGVGSIEEAIELREDGFSGAIIILSSVLEKFYDFFLNYNLIPTIVDLGFARNLNRGARARGRPVPVHVKIDTGMGRLGLCYSDAYKFIKELSRFSHLIVNGIYTHFPVADSDPEFTNRQIEAFNTFVSRLKNEGIEARFLHCANSIGIMRYPQAHFNMVRPGLILYGIQPASNIALQLEPVLSLKSKVIFIKRIEKGMSVSYGRTYIAEKARRIATVAVGYADGYPWALSNRSRVIIKNRFFNIAGRVCMDHIMVDVGNTKSIAVADKVTLLGACGNKRITAEELAVRAGTIPYEIISRLSARIPRIYKD